MNVLYVEDNKVEANLLIRMFSQVTSQLNISWVTTISEAMDRLTVNSSQQSAYDVLLTDIRLPDGNGISLLPFIQEQGLKTAVVVLTNTGNDEEAISALKAGASDYVIKHDDYLNRLPAILESASKRFQNKFNPHLRFLREDYYRSLIENILAIIFMINSDGNVLYINPTVEKFLGFLPEEVIGKNISNFIHPGDLLALKEICLQAEFDPSIFNRPLEVRYLHKDGSWITFEAIIQKTVDMAGQTSYVINARDITDRKQTEETLAREQYLMRTLMDNTPDSIYFKDEQSRFIRISRSMAKLWNLNDPSQAIGKTDFDFFSLEHAKAAYEDEKIILQTGQPIMNLEEKETWPDRPPRWVLTNKLPLRNQTGIIVGTFGISRNITQRRQAELALQESEARYRRLFEDAVLGVFQSTFDGRIISVNPAFAHMFGYESPEDVLASVKDIGTTFYAQPERRLEIIRIVIENPEMHTFETLFRRKNGSTFDGVLHVRVISDSNSNLNRLEGFIEDITKRKQREREDQAIASLSKALREASSRAKMLKIVLDQVKSLLNIDSITLEMIDPNNGDAIVELASGLWESTIGLHIPPNVGLNSYIRENGRPYVTNNVDEDPKTIDRALFGDSQSVAGAPMMAGGQMIGFIWFSRKRQIEESELHLLMAIADTAANAINRITLLEKAERNVQRLAALQDINRAIRNNFDLQNTLVVVLEKVIDQLHVDAAEIFLIDKDEHDLYFAAGKGFTFDEVKRTHIQIGQGLAGSVFLNNEIIQIPDLSNTTADIHFREELDRKKMVAYFGISLVAKGSKKGVLEVFHRSTLNPDHEWLNYLAILADHTAIVIDEIELFESLKNSNQELVLAYEETIEGWSRALDLRDRETEGHTQRVLEMTIRLAREIGVEESNLVLIHRGALLHDIGKMGIPDKILLKPGPLTSQEWDIMHLHPQYAYDMLSHIAYLRPSLDIPYCHHEKWDGSGYPRHLKGEEIPLAARIFAIVDVWDALTSDRPYRSAWTKERAMEYIRSQSGIHFDPGIVEKFIKMFSY